MTLHVETTGQGPNLVLLHGWGLHGGIWNPVRDALAREFTLHIVDLPGHGYSRAARFGSLSDLAAQVAAVLPRDYALCGWSLGGQVALRLALDGANIGKLILVSTTPCFAQRADWPHAMTPAVLADFASRLSSDYRKTLLNFLNLQALNDGAARKTIHALRDELFARGEPHPDALGAGLQVLAETDLRGQVGGIRTPSLSIHGDRDALTPFEAGEWLAQSVGDGTLLAIERCAHVPFLSYPDCFASETTSFLRAI
jgi:pimeloyl-[acyl-carrier protein] methyl ester esterase